MNMQTEENFGTIPVQLPFRNFMCNRYIFISIENVALFRIFSFAKSANLSEISLWNFFEIHCKIDGRSVSTWKILRGNCRTRVAKFYFRKELLYLFMELYAQALENGHQ